jgi:DNA sulfur modification protein DndB
MTRLEFSIPAIRGIQGRHALYTAMLPLRLLERFFAAPADERRASSESHIQHLADSIVAKEADYHVPAISVCVESKVRFTPLNRTSDKSSVMGDLHVPLDARFAVIDGQDRVQALLRALHAKPTMRDQCVAVTLHVDPAASRRAALLSDIRRYERRTPVSKRIATDDEDAMARLTRDVIKLVPVFDDAIEMEKTAISNRSRKLFTLSALYHANRILLADQKQMPLKQQVKLAAEFWVAVSAAIPDWSRAVVGEISAAEMRAAFVHCHAIGVAAIARAGRALMARHSTDWKQRLQRLSTLDWSRKNTKLWEGRAMIGGKLSKSSSAVARAGNAVKKHLGLKLSREESSFEA